MPIPLVSKSHGDNEGQVQQNERDNAAHPLPVCNCGPIILAKCLDHDDEKGSEHRERGNRKSRSHRRVMWLQRINRLDEVPEEKDHQAKAKKEGSDLAELRAEALESEVELSTEIAQPVECSGH